MGAGCRHHCLPVLADLATQLASADHSRFPWHFLDHLLEQTGASQGSVMVLDDRGDLVVLAARGPVEKLRPRVRVRPGAGVAGWVVTAGVPLCVGEIREDGRFAARRGHQYPSGAFISCPLHGPKGPFGVINISGRSDGEPFSPRDFTLVRIVAGLAAVTLGRRIAAVTSQTPEREEEAGPAAEAMTAFISRISHDLRTPLHAIKGAIYFLSREGGGNFAERRDFLNIIATEVDNLIALTQGELRLLESEERSPH